jgi:hypothetical protein
MLRKDSKKYPYEIKEVVKITLKKELGNRHSYTDLDDQIEVMTKVEMMDKYFESHGKEINSSEICRVIHSIFGFDLDAMPILFKVTEEQLEKHSITGDTIPLSRIVIDSFLEQHGKEATAAEIRGMINQIIGTNLEGISALEGSRISLFSKGQWIVRSDKDLVVVHTGPGDVDARIFPTNYFTEQTGLEDLPNDLQHSLTSLGYNYNEKIRSYYYSNPTGKAVPDSFKGQTLGAIIKVIRESYSHL